MYFFNGNQESYFCFDLAQRVTQNMDSNYEPIETRKNGRLTFSSQILLGNIFSILRDHSSQNEILGERYISGELLTILNRFENVLKSDLQSPFRQ